MWHASYRVDAKNGTDFFAPALAPTRTDTHTHARRDHSHPHTTHAIPCDPHPVAGAPARNHFAATPHVFLYPWRHTLQVCDCHTNTKPATAETTDASVMSEMKRICRVVEGTHALLFTSAMNVASLLT